jgi:hypothetical protein
MEPIKINQYASLQLASSTQYGYALQEGWVTREGEFKVNFCKREFGKKGSKTEKTVPVSIPLGNKETAIATLTMLLKEISGSGQQQPAPPTSPNRYPQEPPEDDIPF